jgi:hypothetical protein
MADEFNYNDLWNEQEKKIELKIEKEVIANLPKGNPRPGVNITKRFRVKR